MAGIFYLIGTFFFLRQLGLMSNTERYYDRFQKLKEINKRNDDKRPGEKKENAFEDPNMAYLISFSLFHIIWLFIGALFAGQWILFVALIGWGFLMSFYRRRFYKDSRLMSIKVMKFTLAVSAAMHAFIILNHFHHII